MPTIGALSESRCDAKCLDSNQWLNSYHQNLKAQMQPNSSSEADAGDFPSSPFDPDLASSGKGKNSIRPLTLSLMLPGRCRVLSRSQAKLSVDRLRARLKSRPIGLLQARMRPTVDRRQQPPRHPNGALHRSRPTITLQSRFIISILDASNVTVFGVG